MTQTEIRNEFKNCENLEQAKKVYRKLSKKLHPDIGGSDEAMKDLNAVYTHLIENEIFFSNETGFNIDAEKIVRDLLHFDDLIISVCGCWIWVGGETKEHKETLKNHGFRWSKTKKEWYNNSLDPKKDAKRNFRGNTSKDEIISKYGQVFIQGESLKRIA